MHQRSVLSSYLFVVVFDFIIQLEREGELLYADDLVLMCEIFDGLRIKFIKWKKAFESKGLNLSILKTEMTVRLGNANYSLSNVEIAPCEVCGSKVRASSVLCAVW